MFILAKTEEKPDVKRPDEVKQRGVAVEPLRQRALEVEDEDEPVAADS